MLLPLTELQCFVIAILGFALVGFLRGWRRESLTLVFVLLAFVLIQPNSSRSIGEFISRLPSSIGYLITGNGSTPSTTAPADFFGGPLGSLLLFAALIALGYYLGNRAFSKPTVPHDRFLGIIPAIISGAFILTYLSNYLPKNATGQPYMTVDMPTSDPNSMVPVIFVIAIVAVVIALIVARTRKAQPGKK